MREKRNLLVDAILIANRLVIRCIVSFKKYLKMYYEKNIPHLRWEIYFIYNLIAIKNISSKEYLKIHYEKNILRDVKKFQE